MSSTPYSAFPSNSFRESLQNNRRQIGLWASLGSPITTEIIGLAGFDWILLDAEHAPNDVLTLIPQLMALKDSVSAPEGPVDSVASNPCEFPPLPVGIR